MSIFASGGGGFPTPDTLSFGQSGTGTTNAPVNAEDNDTYVLTDDGTATGTPSEWYKWDAEAGVWAGPFEVDDDVTSVLATLSGADGDDLNITVTEGGTSHTDTVDLTPILTSLTYGSTAGTPPTSATQQDNDTHIVTDDGSPTGEIEEMWKYDEQAGVWIEIPLGSTCPDPMTRAALIALRNAGSLSKDCHYVITDYNRGTVGAATIELHAVDETTLSMDANVNTAFDNVAWHGRYDIDLNRLIFLADNLGNEVTQEDSVDNFPWGVAAVTDNRLLGGRLTYTAGTVQGVVIGRNSTVNMIAGILRESTITGDSDLTIRSGDNFELTVDGSSNINQVGTGYIRRTSATNESTVTVGNTNLNDNRFERTTFNSTGSAGSVNYNTFTRSTLTVNNVPSLTLDSNAFSANSQMSCTGASRVYVRYTTMSGFGRILQSAGTLLDCSYTGIRDYAYIQVITGRLYANYNSLSGVSYIQQSGPTGTNRVERSMVSESSRIRFLNTVVNCQVYYCTISSGSYIEHRGTSSGCYFYYCEVSSVSNMYSNNSVNLRGYYMSATGNSQYYSQNVTATHYAFYNVMSAHGYIRHYNSSGGRIYAVHCSGQGLLNLVGANANGRIYYSSFHAYYYLTAQNWTVTRTALHGYGRRSYTVTNPPSGTFTQNF